jgi:hypothetical protein
LLFQILLLCDLKQFALPYKFSVQSLREQPSLQPSKLAERKPLIALDFCLPALVQASSSSYLVLLLPMTHTNAQAIEGTPFAPWALVPVSVGCTTVNLYPIVDHTMMVHEHTHAFQINKTALALQALDLCIMPNALRAQLNLSASIKGMIEEWLRFF